MNVPEGIARPKVLLVEDDALLAEAYLEMLGAEPCNVTHRTTVAGAIEAVSTKLHLKSKINTI